MFAPKSFNSTLFYLNSINTEGLHEGILKDFMYFTDVFGLGSAKVSPKSAALDGTVFMIKAAILLLAMCIEQGL